MIILHQFPPMWGIPNPSPFCVKVETYLRLAGIPYQNNYSINMSINPKHKFPAIQEDKMILGDSEIIIDYLKEKYGNPLDENLTDQQKALGIFIDRLFSEHAYWIVVCFRWKHEPEWSHIKESFFGKIPALLRCFIVSKAKKSFVKAMYNQGMGRHSFEELLTMIDKDFFALSTILGDKPFFLGDKPSSYDCTAYGFLINVFKVPFEHKIKDLALKYPNLEAYTNRMDTLFKESSKKES